MINLTIEGISLDWSKNGMGVDYGFLFQIGDQARRPSDQVNYDYYADNPGEDVAPMEQAFVRPLAKVLPRLDLLGYTLESARAEYEALLPGRDEADAGDPDASRPDACGDASDASGWMSFEAFCALAGRYRLDSLDGTYVEYSADTRPVKGRFTDDDVFSGLPTLGGEGGYSERSYFGDRVAILSACAMLQVFGQTAHNANAEVMWQFGPLAENGWVDISAFYAGARRRQTILVATEGSSDVHILKRALDLLRPNVADFFKFIDVSERHPFSGIGNLVKFAEGLVKIDVQNQALFVFDNDAEGVDAHHRVKALGLPPNMRTMLLPDLDLLRAFPARGPEGIAKCDINGRAAAIECYLDLALPGKPPASVLWTNYKKELDIWQGTLEFKETYMRHFLVQTPERLAEGGYDTAKLDAVLDALLAHATILAEGGEGAAQ
jgi:hypothetical protein